MKIQVNGGMKETSAETVGALLRESNLLTTQVAVELNGTVLFRHELAETRLREGDRVEIVRAAAGG